MTETALAESRDPEARKQAILSGWQSDIPWLEGFLVAMGEVDIVSFAVFDTVVTRVVETQADIFALVEERLLDRFGPAFADFAEAREQAGAGAGREAAFGEILQLLPRLHPATALVLDSTRDLELAMELDNCLAVPEIHAAVGAAIESGKRVIFVAESCHDRAFIQALLAQAGYPANLPVLTSAETGCSQRDGTQWVEVVRQTGAAPGRILHVGSDPWNDDETARVAGLKVLPFIKARSEQRRAGPLNAAVLPFSHAARAQALRRRQGDEPLTRVAVMRELGESWGAIVVGAYVRWIAERASAIGVDRLLFPEHEGWLTQRAWEAAGLDKATGIASQRLPVSRGADGVAEAVGSGAGRLAIAGISWDGAIQGAVADALRAGGEDTLCYGLYVGLWPEAQVHRARAGWLEAAFGSSFVPREDQIGLRNGAAILERLFSSPEGRDEAIIRPFQDAVVETIARIYAGEAPDGLTPEDLTIAAAQAALGRIVLAPTLIELSALGAIEWGGDAASLLAPKVGKAGIDVAGAPWPVGAALAALHGEGDPQSRPALVATIRRQLGHYGPRMLEQFQ